MESFHPKLSGGFQVPLLRPWSKICQYTVATASSGITAGPSFFQADFAISESGKIDKAGPHVGNPNFVNQGIETKPESLRAFFTAFQSFHGPAFFLVNHEGLTEESNSNPALAITGAIQGAIYPAGALNHGRHWSPANW